MIDVRITERKRGGFDVTYKARTNEPRLAISRCISKHFGVKVGFHEDISKRKPGIKYGELTLPFADSPRQRHVIAKVKIECTHKESKKGHVSTRSR